MEILEPADYQAAIEGSSRSYTVLIIPPGLVGNKDIEVGVS